MVDLEISLSSRKTALAKARTNCVKPPEPIRSFKLVSNVEGFGPAASALRNQLSECDQQLVDRSAVKTCNATEQFDKALRNALLWTLQRSK